LIWKEGILVKGIVLEKRANGFIVLTESGEFKEYRNTKRNWEIGDKVEVPAASDTRYRAFAVAVAAILLMTLLPQYVARIPVDRAIDIYYTIDINPSIELGVSHNGMIVSVEAKNEDARRVLESVSLHKCTLQEGVASIMEQAFRHGYLKSNVENEVFITQIDMTNKQPEDIKKAQLNTAIKSSMDILNRDGLVGNVHSISLSPKVREEAERYGLTTGKYAIMLLAEEKGIHLTAEEVKSESIKEVIEEIGNDFSEIVKEAENSGKFKQVMEEQDNENEKAEKNASQEKEKARKGNTQKEEESNNKANLRKDNLESKLKNVKKSEKGNKDKKEKNDKKTVSKENKNKESKNKLFKWKNRAAYSRRFVKNGQKNGKYGEKNTKGKGKDLPNTK